MALAFTPLVEGVLVVPLYRSRSCVASWDPRNLLGPHVLGCRLQQRARAAEDSVLRRPPDRWYGDVLTAGQT